MSQETTVHIHPLDNGMTIVAEPMAEVSSAAFAFLLPGGVAYEQPDCNGAAAVLSELAYRGAGEMDSRTLSDRLDRIGLQRHNSVSTLHSSFGGALVADHLLEALRLHAEILRRPQLDGQQFSLCRELALQALDSIDDDPRQKIGMLTQEQFFPQPYGRWNVGKREDLQQLEISTIRALYEHSFTPTGAILAVAGAVDMASLVATVEDCFGDWHGPAQAELPKAQPQSRQHHLHYDGAQVHIGLMTPSIDYTHHDYFHALALVSILSGGMGSRLFTEVREKRGLCYAVGATHKTIGPFGALQCYLGSTPDKAQEGLDVLCHELRHAHQAMTHEELDRAIVGLRTSLIMQGESTSARALAAARDYYYLGRVRSLEEIENNILSLSLSAVQQYALEHQPEWFTMTTIGPKELTLPAADD